MSEQMEVFLIELSEKLGTTVTHLWSVLVQQAFIEGIVRLMVVVILITVSIVTFIFLYKKTTVNPNNEPKYPECEDDDTYVPWGVWIVCNIFLFTIVFVNLHIAITALINPEYWALKQILP